ncbi:hypothetical protein EDB84DRAFT_1441654 [Lactarius hengduanensis]|nr:hypothetical protein EDB84DRAFT_1441654 [Lactarius hengduanensis]
MKKMKGKEKSASRVEENITAHLRQASPNPRVPALTRTLHLQDRNDEMVSWDGNGEVGVDRGAAAACHRLALSNVFACAEGSLEFEAGPPGSKTRRGARGYLCARVGRVVEALKSVETRTAVVMKTNAKLKRAKPERDSVNGGEVSGKRGASVNETSWTVGSSCDCGTTGIAGEARDKVASTGVVTESIVLSPGGRCGGVERGEMVAFGGASSDAGGKLMDSPCDDSDSENSGDSGFSVTTSAADTGVDSNSQGLDNWLRDPDDDDD